MNIGFFTDSFRPYTSGVVRSIELFSREYTNIGHSVYIFCPDYPLMHPPKEEGVFRFISVPLAEHVRFYFTYSRICTSQPNNSPSRSRYHSRPLPFPAWQVRRKGSKTS